MIHVYGGYFFSECDLFETRTNGTKMPNKIHKLHEKLPNKIHKLSTAHCLSTNEIGFIHCASCAFTAIAG